MWGLILLLSLIVAGFLVYRHYRKGSQQKIAEYRLPATTESILREHVSFYTRLDSQQQEKFKERIRRFLASTRITGVGGVIVSELDRLLVASSAIIPIFYFDGWGYNNISEVLLYKDTFNHDYSTDGAERQILGMVGDGALHRQMILSQPALHAGFARKSDGQNTAIHEFVHLLDKADGSVDGVPEYLLDKEYTLPWLKEMHKQMSLIRNDASKIDPYAATNEAEFLAVAAEYFFEKPGMLENNHPQLFTLLNKIFRPEPDDAAKS